MADRRMISKKVITKDAFASLSDKSQLLYYMLLMSADDDGFVENSRQVMATCRANKKSLDALCDAGFLIKFQSGPLVIRHWKIHNLIAKDRYKPTLCKAEREQLTLDESGAYVLSIDSEEAMRRFLNTKC